MDNSSFEVEHILSKLGITALNGMQKEMLKMIDQNKDIILCSPTGSGKTLGFLLPLVQKIKRSPQSSFNLIITPTRELALQIQHEFQRMGTGIRSVICYGGHSIHAEKKSLETIPQLLIGTPGRIRDHITRRHLPSYELELVIFDEFDKTLELGFEEDIHHIISHFKSLQQYLFVSATKALKIPSFFELRQPISLDYKVYFSNDLSFFEVRSPTTNKIDSLVSLLSQFDGESTLIFLNHREAVERVHKALERLDFPCEFFHGGLLQAERELRLLKFRNGTITTLVTTDLGARGLDIPQVRHIVHYQQPDTLAQYIHRNGRTARMHAKGNIYILLSKDEQIKEYIDSDLIKMTLEVDMKVPCLPDKVTLAFDKGKKDKVNKTDILGYLTKVGGLQGSDVGRIDIRPLKSYAAIPRHEASKLLHNLQGKKIKGKTVRIKLV